jgi:hypothetical protein
MLCRSQIVFYLLSLVSIVAISGCVALNSYHPAEVVVRDAETKKPIPSAQVRICYPLTRSSFAPHESVGTTNNAGIASLEIATCEDSFIMVDAKADGFMSRPLDISSEAERQMKTSSWLNWNKPSIAHFTVEMYALPRFCIEFALPAGYRGLVKAQVEFQEQIPCRPGQRNFNYQVQSSGDVEVRAPNVLGQYPPVYRAKSADGTLLTEDMDATKIGFRWLNRDGTEEYFVVGTLTEYESYQRAAISRSSGSEKHSSASAKERGRGGRRNRGDPTAAPMAQ